ncbi:hypothetical protein BGZ76_007506, partial [Entomortierella beljakovae]
MKFTYSIVALIAAAVVKAQSPAFTNCAPADADMTINSFTLHPYPMCRGQNLCITGTGVLSVPITSGSSLSVIGLILGNPVYTDIQDLCTLLAAQGNPCPVPITATTITACVLLKPISIAKLSLPYTISASNGGGSNLFCQNTPSAL